VRYWRIIRIERLGVVEKGKIVKNPDGPMSQAIYLRLFDIPAIAYLIIVIAYLMSFQNNTYTCPVRRKFNSNTRSKKNMDDRKISVEEHKNQKFA
jgi:hypothetical protein